MVGVTENSIEPTVEQSVIRDYYAGKSIFLTGATGFMGKCFVEKVLRDIPDLKKLFVLVREKKGVPPIEKMKRYFQNSIFDRLRREHPSFEQKVVTIVGDLQEDKLGMSDEDRQTIIEEVEIFVHNGATTKFDEAINVALKINVLATKQMLDLAMECRRVLSFTYVSTAYSHCYNKDIEEKFYGAPADLSTVYDMIEADTTSKHGLSEESLKMLLGKWPNVYCFTKSIAEDLVRQYGEKGHFACAVYRPSIVSAALKEPMVGWIGNNNGPALIFLGTGLGVLHCTYTQNDPNDLVPVDFSINSLIAVTYDAPSRCKNEGRAVVYNYGSSTVNPTRFSTMYVSLTSELSKIGSANTLWHPFFFFCKNIWQFALCHLLFHFIPAVLADIALLCMGRKPMTLNLFWFGTKHLSKVFYFTNGNWKIHIQETLKVYDKLPLRDRELFAFDIRTLDWDDFVKKYTRGVRHYILKEPMDDTQESFRHYKRMRTLHYFTMGIFICLISYYFLRFFSGLLQMS